MKAEEFRIDSKLSYETAHPLYSASSWPGLDPTRIAYNTCRLDGRLKLTVFNQLQPVCQQSRSQRLLLHRTRRFFPAVAETIARLSWREKLDEHRDGIPAKGGHQSKY